jgi:SMI1 / KNR4 family (SUKH-1)
MALDELLDRISKFPRFTAGVGASAGDITAAATSLGVKLPDPYAKFLQRFGWAWWPGGGLYGVQNAESLAAAGHDYDTARVTARQRGRQWPAGFKQLPEHGNVLHCSEEIVFLFGDNAKRAGQVAVFNYSDQAGEEVASHKSFEKYLQKVIEYQSDEFEEVE